MVAVAMACLSGLSAAEGAGGQRPNVIIILTDDQGYGDFSCHGHPVLKTPNIDRLHDASVRFTDFHVAPVCTPTRGQLMTGLDALHNLASMVPSGRNLMRRDIPTMPAIFRASGYRTGLFGKWHLGDAYPDRPMDRGFERVIWFRGWGLQSEIEFDNDYQNTRYLDGLEVKSSGRYCTDLWFEEAMRWMEERGKAGEPFFCYLPTNAPHGPLWVEEKYAARYPGKNVPSAFFGMIANIDDNVGRLDEFLARVGLIENTIVVLMNDNGGTAGTKVYNAGLRGGKGQNFDGGHRAACFVRWPAGSLAAGADCSVPAQIQDLLPTFIELCGLKAPEGASFDGLSLAPLLRDPKAGFAERMLVVQYGGRINPEKGDACVIWGRWRLVNGRELYDIEEDRAQERDVAARHADVVESMSAHYEKWWAGVEPNLREYVPVIVGSGHENPVPLTCNNWEAVDVDNARRVGEAAGGPRGGPWNLHVEREGEYQVELRRWPFHTRCALGSEGPTQTVFGRAMQQAGKKLPIAGAVLAVAGVERSAAANGGDLGVSFKVRLPAGRTKMQGWFRDAAGKDLCGAFYAQIRRM